MREIKLRKFIAIKYHNKIYPDGIDTSIEEIAGHFDVGKINPTGKYSLHTEYSYGKRSFDKPILEKCGNIIKANRNGVPQLWISKEWSLSFACYIKELTKGYPPPELIEIHPPFKDYIKDIQSFIDIYQHFEEKISSLFPDTKILLENRCGSIYRGSRFLIMKAEEIVLLVEEIKKRKLKLKITLDIPQLFTGHPGAINSAEKMINILETLKPITGFIYGIHLWGKRKSQNGRNIAHVGDLNSYFDYNENLKQLFLATLADIFNDDVERYLVLEVNSGNEDMLSILSDLIKAGFSFR